MAQGLPFTETFDSTLLRDAPGSTAAWIPAESHLTLPVGVPLGDPFVVAAPVRSDIGTHTGAITCVVSADFDGDGDPDLAFGATDGPIHWRPNNGAPAPFDAAVKLDVTVESTATLDLAAGDVDNDGDIDLIAGISGAPNRLFLNNGGVNPFHGAVGMDVSSDADATAAIVLYDIDKDGDLDLIAGNGAQQPTRLYLNNGTANPFFGVGGISLGAPDRDTLALAVADFNNDGLPDLIEGNDNQLNRLFVNNGTSNPFAGQIGIEIALDRHATRALAVGDFDRDGWIDFIAANENAPSRLYLNTRTSNPFNVVQGVPIGAGAGLVSGAAVSDFDRDGDLDILLAGPGESHRLHLNSGSDLPFADEIAIANDYATVAVIALDADGDGDIDLVEANNGNRSQLLLNTGISAAEMPAAPWNAVESIDLSAATWLATSVAAGDLNGDGRPDLVIAVNNGANRHLLNSGCARPFEGVADTAIASDVHLTEAIAVADLNGDNRVDVVAANRGQANRIYFNNGTSAPFSGVMGDDLSGGADDSVAILIADFNHDTFPDIVVGNDGQANMLLLNNGTGDPFGGAMALNVTADTHETMALAAADVNGDNRIDLVTGNWGQPNRLYLNNGTADPFNGVSGTDITADAHFTSSLALGDVNGDLKPDLVAGNLSASSRLYLNNGSSTPFAGVAGAEISASSHNVHQIALIDIDHDGDLDLLSALFNHFNTYHLNDGTGASFSSAFSAPLAPEAGNSTGLTAADFNDDGRQDVVVANLNQRSRYHTRLWRTSPASASSLEVDTESDYITVAILTAAAGIPSNTGIDYFLSNNGGARWFRARPGVELNFPTFGADLRWRAELRSLSPVLAPELDSLTITAQVGLDAKNTWRTMHWPFAELEAPELEATVWGDAANPDDDPHNNLFEYIAGTVPTDINSFFSLAIEPAPGQPTHRAIVFSPRLPDRIYVVQWFPSVTSSTPTILSGAPVSDDGNVRTVTDTNPDGSKRFYRVEISLP